MATTHQIQTRGARRRSPRINAVFSIVVGIALGASVGASASRRPLAPKIAAMTSSYSWPVKPFDSEHPVRGFFGDPRTMFAGPPTRATVLHGHGSFSFHQGIDISAPNGTPVYPVISGRVTAVTHEWVRVSSGGGHAFEYWHIEPAVRIGDDVSAQETILGRIMRPAEHVHLTELLAGEAVNPLAPGHIGPYTDTTTPSIASVALRRTDGGPELLPGFVRGRVEFIVQAYDHPTYGASGTWKGLPTTPALLKWRIDKWNGAVAVPTRVAYDHRKSEPENAAFWQTYARGTYQNMSVFGKHYSWLQAGAFAFRLTPLPFDTKSLHDGVYHLVVTVADTRGNEAVQVLCFTVHNRPGWVGS